MSVTADLQTFHTDFVDVCICLLIKQFADVCMFTYQTSNIQFHFVGIVKKKKRHARSPCCLTFYTQMILNFCEFHCHAPLQGPTLLRYKRHVVVVAKLKGADFGWPQME